jgi:dipeptidyl aminopeptidase/acylaminoacyl peptidase
MTPFGYLNEPRAYWEAVATYTRVSPVSVASRIEAPLLLIHGAWDENEATAPPQSRQLYEALRRVGTPTRYVHLPRECHGFGPAECARHAVAEMIEWCDRYVAGAPAVQ